MTKNQKLAYDRACKAIHEFFGSYNTMAMRAHPVSGTVLSQETVRIWFRDRKIPAEFVFALYELMNCEGFNPLDLLPYLKPHVVLKKGDPVTS